MADFNSSCRDRRRLPERSVLWLIAAFLFAGALAWGTKDGPIMPPSPAWLILAKITLLSMLLALGRNHYRYLLQLEQGAERGELPEWAEPDCFELTERRNRTGLRRVRARATWFTIDPPPWVGRGQYDSMIPMLSQIFAIGCLAFLSLALDLTPVSWAGLSPDALLRYSMVTFIASVCLLGGLLFDFFGKGEI